MELSVAKEFLLYGLIINYTVLIVWFCAFSLAHDFVYRIHSRWFKLSNETFDAIHYVGMAFYKLGILIFNLAPLLAIMMIG